QGWTNQEFEIPCELDSGKLYSLIRISHPNTKITVLHARKIMKQVIYKQRGWVNLAVDIPGNKSHAILKIVTDKPVLSNMVNPRQYGKKYTYGIRLSQNFCRHKKDRDIAYSRGDFIDEHRFEKMSLQEYRNDYYERLYRDAPIRPETARMNMLHQRKQALAGEKFQPWIEFAYLKKGVAKALQNNIEVVLVNNPENPLELGLYGDSTWYKEYLVYLEELSSDKSYKFYDLRDYLKDPRSFIDPHHLTLPASHKMTEVYMQLLK
ncbi:MAG: hypothetical protein AAF518_27725, partial [Spirochaetota bacterium]